jgi:hypothetical protein
LCIKTLLCVQGMKNPLDNVSQMTPRAASKPEDKAKKAATGMYQYFLKVFAEGRGCHNMPQLPLAAVQVVRLARLL